MSELMAVVRDPESSYDVVFEDDGRVAYAYLRNRTEIVSDVWVYNSGPTPEQPEWTDRSKMPFANPRGFTSTETPPQLESAEDVSAHWIRDRDHVQAVDVFLKGQRYARLAPGAKPGWSKLARREGPLALPLR